MGWGIRYGAASLTRRDRSGRKRCRRWQLLAETFPQLAEMSVIDLGGSVESWRRAPVRPKHVHVVNLAEVPTEVPDWAEVDYGDACALPEKIMSRRYDLTFSNSVIENVGGHERRQRFADNVRSLADSYWVQTPYRYFPVEPHFIAPSHPVSSSSRPHYAGGSCVTGRSSTPHRRTTATP
jgi:hypothetical protein